MKKLLVVGALLSLTACTSLKDVDHAWCPPEEEKPAVEMLDIKADALFKFDKHTQQDMLPAGIQELDNLAKRLQDVYTHIQRIQITGHTDYLGSDAYNQALSEHRAQTVAHYLQQKGIQAQFDIIGMGERQPVHTCSSQLRGQALRDCLQPNRRVEIQITGVRKIIKKQ